MKYTYRARTKDGKVETGTIDAYSEEAAALLLQKYNLFVTSLQEYKEKEFFLRKIKFETRVSKKELAIFFRQLSVMLESRVPVVQSLSSLAVQTRKENFKKIILEIANLVEGGVSLSEAFAAYPKVFDSFSINLVKSGEASGNISGALNYISEHLERENDIIVQVRQAMIYPILVLCVLLVVIGVIIVVIMPKVADLIKEADSKPPLLTQIVLNFYKFLQNYWWIIAIVFFLLIAFLIYYFNTKEGKKSFNKISLKIPLVSGILKKVFVARFCGNISTLLAAGISINRALKITEDTVNNIVYKEIVAEVGKNVSEGEKMSYVLIRYPNYFPPFVVQMIKIGEETGKLDKTLVEVVSFYQKEIQRAIDLFTRLLEPIMIIFLGLVVGLLAVSILIPLFGALGTI